MTIASFITKNALRNKRRFALSVFSVAVSLFLLVSRGGMAVGSLATGALVHWRGVREAFLICGVLAIAAQLLIARPWLRAAAAPLDPPATGAPVPPVSATAGNDH